MTRYAALLRGVNVGGITIKMADLAELVRGLGYANVKTVLASGNVLLDSDEAPDAVTPRLEGALRERFGYDAWVHVRATDDLARLAAAYPFPRSEDRHAYLVFAADDDARARLLEVATDPAVERVAEGDRVVYWSVPKGSTLSTPFGAAQGSSRFKQWVTTRNLNTVQKLIG